MSNNSRKFQARIISFLVLSLCVCCRADTLPDGASVKAFINQMSELSATDPALAVEKIEQYKMQYGKLDPLWLARLDCKQAWFYSTELDNDKQALAVLERGMLRSDKPAAYLLQVKLKFRIMSETDKPAAIAYFKTQLPKFLPVAAGSYYYFRDAYQYYDYIVRVGGKPEDASEVILAFFNQHPQLISYGTLISPLIRSLLKQKGREEEALSYAKVYWMICKFDAKSINEATAQLQKVWIHKDLNAGRSNAFLKSMQDIESPNPLKKVVLPEQDAERISIELAYSGLSFHDRITLLILQRSEGKAMLTARRFLLDDPAKNASEAVLEIARIFKANDLNLIRANAYLQYFKSGQGDNPVDNFFKEHPVGANTVKNAPVH